jgi:putative inorganic carbon (HCO3(-)) transporter
MVHNGYLQTALTNGLPALLLYLLLIALIVIGIYKAYRGAPERDRKVLLLAFLAAIIGYLLQDLRRTCLRLRNLLPPP